MNPVSPDSDNDDLPLRNDEATSRPSSEPSPLENLQRRYTDQLSADIEQLEAAKAQLQGEISALRQDYAQLQADARSRRHSPELSTPSQYTGDSSSPEQTPENPSAPQPSTELDELPAAERLLARTDSATDSSVRKDGTETKTQAGNARERGPKLPGEAAVPPPPLIVPAPEKGRSIELPTPATSEQRRQLVVQRQKKIEPSLKAQLQKGLVLSAIATLLTAWHYGLVSTLHQGGRWLDIDIGQLGSGFVPAVALLWLRMFVMVPTLVVLAPHLYRNTWEDLQDWFYNDEQLFLPLVGSGIALFFSQVFLYQSIGSTSAVVGSALFFLYPLTAVPLGLFWGKERALSPFGVLAVVAIAMGGLLVAKPALTNAPPTAVWFGLLASVALSLYIVLTNRSYRQRCHPVPTAIVQFSTVAALSSLVLLVKPLEMVSISWLSFCLWGLLIGVLMLVAYLFTYSSLRLIHGKTAIVAATTPCLVLLLSWSFTPQPALEIIQWTGVLLVSIGGVALGKEKLAKGF